MLYGGTEALNRAMTAFCAPDPRLKAVGYLPLNDPARALATLGAGARRRRRGHLGPLRRARGLLAHPRRPGAVWARLAEARRALRAPRRWREAPPQGVPQQRPPRPKDWLGGGENLRSKDFPVLHHSPERFLACMALDGVFERLPSLRGAAIELGASWVPGLLRNVDHALRSFSKFEPALQELTLLPSEYLRRQVRFTPFPFEDTAWLLEQCGPELFMFSTDYPHPEGGKRPFEAFGDAVAGFDEPTRERFFWRNGAELLGLA